MIKQIELDMELYGLLLILENCDGMKLPRDIRGKLNQLTNEVNDLLFKPLQDIKQDYAKLKLYLECEFDSE